jgi:hypothetical protein
MYFIGFQFCNYRSNNDLNCDTDISFKNSKYQVTGVVLFAIQSLATIGTNISLPLVGHDGLLFFQRETSSPFSNLEKSFLLYKKTTKRKIVFYNRKVMDLQKYLLA